MRHAGQKLHIVDRSVSRRATLSKDLREAGYGAQIYEDPSEFIDWSPSQGIVLVNDSDGLKSLDTVSRHLSGAGTFLPVAMYGVAPSATEIVQAMLAGAVDYLEWPFHPEQFQNAIERVNSTEQQRIAGLRRRSEAVAAVSALSNREREVLHLLVAGGSNKIIAANLGVSPRTIEIHRGNMMKKLNAQSTSDAVRIGIYAGLDESD